MKKRAIRNRMVERISRLGDATMRHGGELTQLYHYHNTLEVIVIKRGWVEGLVEGITGVLEENTVVVIGSDISHCILRASDECSVILIHVPTELLKWDEERFPELTHGMEFVINSKSGVIYNDSHFAGKISRLAGRIVSAEGFMRMSLLMRLIHVLSITPPSATLLSERHHSGLNKKGNSSVDRAYLYLYEHFRENFSLSDIAEYSGLNTSALCRSFKKASGRTIGCFCSRLRIEYACNLLLTTNMDVASIAYQSGYNSYTHFSTSFKKAMKISPTEYRVRAAAVTFVK